MKWALSLVTLTFSITAFADAPDGWTEVSGKWIEKKSTLSTKTKDGEAILLTDDAHYDFELSFDFRGGSGATYLRSHWLPEESNPDARKLYGYRVDLSSGKETTTVTETYSGHTLVIASPEAQKAFQKDDWNSMRITAVREVLSLWVNGVKANHVNDEAFIGGRVALVVDEGSDLEFRNVTLTPRERKGEWSALFNGTSLDGWTVYGSERFDVENGLIVGRSGPKKSEGYLLTNRTWTDFRVRGTFWMLGAGNYGLFYRSKITLRKKDDYPLISGVQGEVDPAYPGPSGWHYESYRRGWLHEPPPKESMRAWAAPPDTWGQIEIRCVGNHTTSWINGIRIVDFYDNNPQVFEGGFGLQLHAGGADGIQWKDLYVLESTSH